MKRTEVRSQKPEPKTGVLPKPATWRIVVDPNFSFALGGVPPSRLKRWLIYKLLGWRVEFTHAGEPVTAEKIK